MKVRYTDNVEADGLTQHRVRISKQTLGKVIDFFTFNIEDKKFEFDTEGRLEGIEGVPWEITDLVNSIFEVTKNRLTFKVDIEFVTDGFDSEQVSERILKNLYGDERALTLNVRKITSMEDV